MTTFTVSFPFETASVLFQGHQRMRRPLIVLPSSDSVNLLRRALPRLRREAAGSRALLSRRLGRYSTSCLENAHYVARSSVQTGLVVGRDKTISTRVAATIIGMIGLWVCTYRSLKAYLQEGGLRSFVG